MKRGMVGDASVSKRVAAPEKGEVAKIVEALKQESDTDALAKWSELTDLQIVAEIAKYREVVAQVEATADAHEAPSNLRSKVDKTELTELTSGLPDSCLLDWLDPEEEEETMEAAAEPTDAPGAMEEEGMEEGNVADIDPVEWMVPPQCIPIHTNVTTFDWRPLYTHCQFDCIMMDPPWALATANPTRGVSLGYSQLTDNDITKLPIPKLQTNGLLFVWVINAKYKMCLDLFKHWGYEFVDEIVWVKLTTNRRLAKSHGFYLQHAKEVCLVAKKGIVPPNLKKNTGSDIIMSERRGQSQKPTEIYDLIEELVPNGKYLEIFARKNNLRNFWVSVGNEVTGTGAPEEDLAAVQANHAPVGAVYGAGSNKK